jgi:hypothetical protein
MGRLEGILAITRAFGDFQIKKNVILNSLKKKKKIIGIDLFPFYQ